MSQQGDLSDELAVVRKALAAKGFSGKDIREHSAVLIHDVAEGTGLPPAEVARHLDRIRLESAWSSTPKTRESVLAFGGAIALIVGVGVFWSQMHRPIRPQSDAPYVMATPPPELGKNSSITPAPSSAAPATINPDFRVQEIVPPPFGVTIHAVSKGDYLVGQPVGTGLKQAAIPYEKEVDSLAASILSIAPAFAARKSERDFSNKFVRDLAGSVFRPKSGTIHITLDGWPGTTEFWIPVSSSDQSKKEILKNVKAYFAELEHQQNAALRLDCDPTKDLVLPPPGLKIEFAGRRLDIQTGPRLAFADIDSPTIAKRIVLAVRNAFERDHRPPDGRWSAPAEVDRNTPIPAKSIVKISRLEDVTTFDFPTSDKWTGEDEKIVEANAKAIAQKILNEFSEPPPAP